MGQDTQINAEALTITAGPLKAKIGRASCRERV